MIRCFTTFVLLLVYIELCTGATIKGTVKDSQTGEEIIGATILLKEQPNKGTVSGLDGSFSIAVDRYPSTIRCSYLGYTVREIVISSEKSGEISILLTPDEVQVAEVVVTGNNIRNTEMSARILEKQASNVINVVSAKAIEISPDLTVANVVQRMSGVTIERNSSGDGQYAILRGMDKRYNYTLVNGVKIPSPDNKNRFVPLDIFPSELLDRLEVSKSPTADMEGDGIGGAVNMVMKDAPSTAQFSARISTGYNSLFMDRDFQAFDSKVTKSKSPYELYGEGYDARPRDFTTGNIDIMSKKAMPNLSGDMSYGSRLFGNRLGLIAAASFQNSYRGSNSLYYSSSNSQSDASNLPVLTSKLDRTYSEQQTRFGAHLKLDYRISSKHILQWYNALMNFSNEQVRDVRNLDLSIGYQPSTGEYNVSYNTRFRLVKQQIFNTTFMGTHRFLTGDKLRINWSAVYSKAANEAPDNATIYANATVSSWIEYPSTVVVLKGAERRWEHNSDEDKAGYLNLSYTALGHDGAEWVFSGGGMYRDKQRTNFFNQYDFRPYDDSKSELERNVLVKGVDWNKNSEIKFMVYTPYGQVGNPLNYDASEKIAAGYLQTRLSLRWFQAIAGLRIEHTDQGYDLKHPTEGVPNIGSQKYYDILPSVHFKYSLGKNQNIRATYAESINRPSFFEIVPYRILNEEYTEAGNPDLKHTIAHNVDLRYEYFPKQSEQFMIGTFYKKIIDPIETGIVQQGQATLYMPANFGNATNYGLEADFIKYFHSFGIKANYTFTKSNITTTKMMNIDNPDNNATDRIIVRNIDQTRPLNGQAMHVANLSILYKNMKEGWDAQLAGSYTGSRLYAVSRYYENDIWQAAYFQMDLSIEKRFRTGIGLFAKASNLLNTPMVHYIKKHNPANMKIVDYDDYNGNTMIRLDYYGQNVQIGCRYKF